MKKNITLLVLLPIIIVVLISITTCGTSDDELMLRSNIQNMRQAITKHQANTFIKHIHETYKSPVHHDINALRDFVNYHLDGNRVIHIYIADIDIEIDDDTAKIIFYSGIAGGPEQIPERGRLFKVGTRWLKTKGQWQLTQAKWRPALIPKKN